ncbi:hypothetical protein QFZ64_002335 [Streptomyces sp. B3I8]|nr:hypothetical protein [Streptomyces sp. B3I8]
MVTATSGPADHEQGLATGLAAMTQQIGITVGAPIMSAIATVTMTGTGTGARPSSADCGRPSRPTPPSSSSAPWPAPLSCVVRGRMRGPVRADSLRFGFRAGS